MKANIVQGWGGHYFIIDTGQTGDRGDVWQYAIDRDGYAKLFRPETYWSEDKGWGQYEVDDPTFDEIVALWPDSPPEIPPRQSLLTPDEVLRLTNRELWLVEAGIFSVSGARFMWLDMTSPIAKRAAKRRAKDMARGRDC